MSNKQTDFPHSLTPQKRVKVILGHDHLMTVPGSGGDFNIAWEPILVLFTTTTATNTRLTTLAHPARWACGPDRDADGIADG